MHKKMTEPKEYDRQLKFQKDNTTHYSGTDLYLTFVTVALTAVIVRTGTMVFMAAHQYTIHSHWMWAIMAITSLVAGKHSLTYDNRMYKTRVYNSIVHGIKTTFIGPFTAVAQMAHSLTNGFKITRNLFD